MSEALEEGYKHLANDPEMYTRRRPEHHCGFDFSDGMPTAIQGKAEVSREEAMKALLSLNSGQNYIVNQVVKCDCNTAKHDPADYGCACDDCLDEQVDRLNEQLVAKAIADTEQRIINIIKKHCIENDEGGTGYCEGCDWKNSYAVGFDDHLIELIKAEQK